MSRTVTQLKYGYKFKFFDSGSVDTLAFSCGFDDSGWQTVRVPHDWAISGEFHPENDILRKTKLIDGVETPIEQTGRTGALPTVGEGVYRLWVDVPADKKDERVTLELDGVMWYSTVYCNGKEVGGCHFGYKSYEVDITDAVVFGAKNLIAVHAVVGDYCCRWYSGAGIYRNVRLVTKPSCHIAYDGVWLKQVSLGKHEALFELAVDAVNAEGKLVAVSVTAPDGSHVLSATSAHSSQLFRIPYPVLWDVDKTELYTARVSLADADGNTYDAVAVRFGVRSSKFTPDGYFLNGRRLKLNGVCMHHDLGSLGAAVSVPALKRQLRILKEMGVNAIRTSHNPPAPELLELCDEMGFLVMDEFFDEWIDAKVTSGYAKHFKKHAVKDLADVMRRDRNHPSVIMWSIGNEIKEMNDPEGWRVAKMLTDAVHLNDPTRPTTAGFSSYPASFDNNLTFYVDVVGLNYKPRLYKKYHEKYPDMIIVGSETESCVSTRGVYHFPVATDIPTEQFEDLAVSAYDFSAPAWAYYAERELAAQADCPYIAGEFIWTGFDYLGEPTPYMDKWPSRSSYFGVVDLAGLPKNRFYAYKAAWTDEAVLHIFPHWSWHGREGEKVPVHVFTSYPSAELFVNGVSQGKLTFESTDEIKRFRMMWNDTVYTPGEITVVAYDDNGKEAARKTVKTASAPHHIRLEADRNVLTADGDDLCYITATIVDKDGTACENETTRLTFHVSGCGEFLTTDAGDQRETEAFVRPDKKALGGKLVACVRTLKDSVGDIAVTCSAEGLEAGTLIIKTE